MSMLPWDGNYSGTKRSLAWEVPANRVPKLRKNTCPPLETASLFPGDDSDRGGRDEMPVDTEVGRRERDSVERVHNFHGTVLRVREFSSATPNGGVLSHGSFAFSQWLVQNRSILDGRRVLELKSGMGALAIFLRKALGVDITTSDFGDKETEYNIAYNCRINNLAELPHIRHTWGDPFPISRADWDIVIAGDIEPWKCILASLNTESHLVAMQCADMSTLLLLDAEQSYQPGKDALLPIERIQAERSGSWLYSYHKQIRNPSTYQISHLPD